MSVRSVVVSALVLLAGCKGCSDGTREPPAPIPSASSVRNVALHRGHDGGPSGMPAPCRVVGPADARALDAWISGDAALTVRAGETGREVRLDAPFVAVPCTRTGNMDVTVLARGTAQSLPSAGEGAGSEHWIATPCAAARTSAGMHRISVTADKCTLHVSGGSLYLWTAPDAKSLDDAGSADAGATDGGGAEPWHRIDGPRDVELAVDLAADARSVDACEQAAKDVVETARAVMVPGPNGRGAAAGSAARARGVARATCSVARARVRARELASRSASDAGTSPLAARIDAATTRIFHDAAARTGDAGASDPR